MPSLKEKLKSLFDLHLDKEQEEKVIESIKRNVEFSGTNLWVLMLAIFIASIGLNVNSTAVIIGAMLISPLMGPIVGAGLALGIHDIPLLKKSLLNLLIATLISTTISSFYFLTSPLSDASSELLARTSPNIYDVLIALFGGLAGIIGASRLEKGNVIPGVAIATALMPPLCTAGYGLATLQWKFLFGAFYLFLINCTFICFATWAMVRYLRYPVVAFLNRSESIKVKSAITIVTLGMTVPAVLLAIQFILENQFRQKANQFLKDHFESNGYTLVFKKNDYYAQPRRIDVAFIQKRFTAAEMDSFQQILNQDYLQNAKLNIRQNAFQFTDEERKRIAKDISNDEEKSKMLRNSLLEQEQGLEPVKPNVTAILKELSSLYPAINTLKINGTDSSVVKDSVYNSGGAVQLVEIGFFPAKNRVNPEDKKRIETWLRLRMNDSLIRVRFVQ